MNAHLPSDIRVVRITRVPKQFHARYHATASSIATHLELSCHEPVAQRLARTYLFL